MPRCMFLKENKMNYNNIAKKLNILFVVLVAIAVCANLYMSDKASTAGNALSELESRVKALSLENENLENKYAVASSMSNLTKLAFENGFTDSQSEFYTSPDLALR